MPIKPLSAIFIVVVLTFPSSAKEGHVHLRDYAKRARIICVCLVSESHDDGSVTATVERNLKGEVPMSIRIRGETGFCVIRGPVARFMNLKQRYLVFLFDENKAGRLGGIIEIDDEESLLIRYLDGFSETVFAKEVYANKLPLERAIAQITSVAESKQPPKNLLADGGFETPETGRAPWTTHGRGRLGSWVVESGTVDVVGSYWKASKGKQSLDLSGHQEMPGTIYQDLRTNPMKQYKIRFSAAANPEPADIANPKHLKVFWGDQELKTIEFSAKGKDFQNVGWKVYEFDVHANGEVCRLRFQSLTHTPCGPILDDISVTRCNQ